MRGGVAGRDKQMSATVDNAVADIQRANAEAGRRMAPWRLTTANTSARLHCTQCHSGSGICCVSHSARTPAALRNACWKVVPQDITRVCLNLFGNGFHAAIKRQKEGGDAKSNPTLKVSTRDPGDAVEFRIRDNGTGIPSEIKDKLFQPFFTTKPTGEGTGLGLSISYDIVTQQHGGSIEVDSRVGDFTEFTVRLPRHRATMAEAAS
jgi:signal transduction histidine kinase